MSTLAILPMPRHGSSGTGNSYYTSAIFCPRKCTLDAEVAAAGGRVEQSSGSSAVGTIFHQLAELYYGGTESNPVAVPTGDLNWGDAIEEAKRLWASFTRRHPGQDFWGAIIGLELGYPLEGNTEQAQIMQAVIGVPYTIRPDMIIRPTEASARRILEATGLVVEPDVLYMLDWKTKGKADADAPLLYQQSDQFASYMMCWNALFPKDPVAGMIVVEPITTKEVKFRHFLISPPDADLQNVVRQKMANGATLVQTNATLGVAHNCRSYNRWCAHHPYVGGTCKRY